MPVVHQPSCSVQMMKHAVGASHPSTPSLKTQRLSHPSAQGQPFHREGPLACVHLRDGTECPRNHPALVLISLHWACRDPQQCQDKTKISAIHLDLSSEMTLSVRLEQPAPKDGASSVAVMSLRVSVRDDATWFSPICQISLDVQDPDSSLAMKVF